MVGIDETYLRLWQEDGAELLRYEYDLKPEDYCLDIGSYHQEWANEIRTRYNCKVDCFEALDNNAAWVYDGEIEMGGQFYYTSMFDKGELGLVQKFKCVDIAPYLQNEVALMKVNIEGGEYELLDYIIEKGLIKNIKNIQVQFHLVDGWDCEKKYKELADKLKLTHTLTWRYPFVWENWKSNA